MQKLTILTIDSPKILDFAKARNELLSEVKSGWVLFLDKDEELSDELRKEIDKAIESTDFVGYKIKREDIFLGKRLHHGETGGVRLLRLARHDAGKFVRPVHEVWEVEGRVGELRLPLMHRPHDGISSFLTKIDIYSTIESEYRKENGIKSSLLHIFCYPPGKFIHNYLVLKGYKDGVPGLIMAIMMSFHSYLTWTKLYLLWLKK